MSHAMSRPPATPPLAPEALRKAISPHLFPDDDALRTYAVLDGARVPELVDHLYDDKPEFVCLYRGELEPDMVEVAPYLVRLNPDTPFTNWVLADGWGQSWGIFALSTVDLERLRRHFRSFLMVKSPDGRQLYFRYYDPRVLRVYLPTCNAEELRFVFGPVQCLLGESADSASLSQFELDNGSLKTAHWMARVPPMVPTPP